MWLVSLTARIAGELKTETVKVKSNRVEKLFENDRYQWGRLEKAMQSGSLVKISIDYKPGLHGTPRIEKDEFDGLFYLTIDRVRVGHGYIERADAWSSQEAYR